MAWTHIVAEHNNPGSPNDTFELRLEERDSGGSVLDTEVLSTGTHLTAAIEIVKFFRTYAVQMQPVFDFSFQSEVKVGTTEFIGT